MRKLIGYIVIGSQPLKGRTKYNGALTNCRPGEAPDLFMDKSAAQWAVDHTATELGDFVYTLVPIKLPKIGIMLYANGKLLKSLPANLRKRGKRRLAGASAKASSKRGT